MPILRYQPEVGQKPNMINVFGFLGCLTQAIGAHVLR